VEYVAENGGGLLQSHAVKLNWYNYHSLDVILLLLCALFVTISAIMAAIRVLMNGIKGRRKLQLPQQNGNRTVKKKRN